MCVYIRVRNCTYKGAYIRREDCTYKRRRCKGTGKKEEMGVYKRIKNKTIWPVKGNVGFKIANGLFGINMIPFFRSRPKLI